MAGLQVLEEELSGQPFHVLGFFSDDFDQAGSDEDIDACNQQHHVTFPEFEIGHVTAPDPQPVFAWILAQSSSIGPEQPLQPAWNFHKYLVSKDGRLLNHFGQHDYFGEDPSSPTWQQNDIILAIQAALAE